MNYRDPKLSNVEKWIAFNVFVRNLIWDPELVCFRNPRPPGLFMFFPASLSPRDIKWNDCMIEI